MRNRLNVSRDDFVNANQKSKGLTVNVIEKNFQKSKVALCVASLCITAVVGANPTGEQVVHGSASFEQVGSQLNITNSDGTIINWQDFSIAQDEAVKFLQSGAQSSVLNRVVSGIPSEILGSLSSNGRVFLINPNGLVIGEGAKIDTASFVGSTLDISDKDFIDGNLSFSGDGGEIENRGYIAAGPNGEAVLIAPTIENHGLIKADDGKILLAAGRDIVLHSLNQGGISYRVSAPEDSVLNVGELVATNGSVKVFADQIFQTGTVSANRTYRDVNGDIVLEADSNLHVSGEITVTGADVDGGDIHLLGDEIDIEGASIDASGASGGEILIGGDYQGKGDVKNAQNTRVDDETTINTDAGEVGNGGRVIIWSDDTTDAFATITARGGSVSGDGGFVETSGKKVLNFGTAVDASATNGAAGTWLLDPEDITIGDSEAEVIETSLNGGSNVEVRTSDEGEGEGNIYVNSSITKTEGDNEVTLTLDAHNRVEVNAPISTTAGPLNVTIKTGRQVAAVDPSTEETAPDDEDNPNQTTENDGEVVEMDNDVTVEGSDNSDQTTSTDSTTNADGTETDSTETDGTETDGIEVTHGIEVTDEADSQTGSDDVVSNEASADSDEEDSSSDQNFDQPDDVSEQDEVAVTEEESDAAPIDSDGSENETVATADTTARDSSEDNDYPDAEPNDDDSDDERQIDMFNRTGRQQIIIAADVFTGGGNVAVDAGEDGEDGEAIIGADIDTSDASNESAGDIVIEADRIAIVDNAQVDASGNEAGDIKIGGGLQGQDDSVRNADLTILAEGASVSADGGTSGDGGFIETSGLVGLTVSGTPDVGSNHGSGGEWLIDPHDILVTDYGETGEVDVSSNMPSPTLTNFEAVANATGPVIIQIDSILSGLENGDVTINTTNASNSGTDQGNINFESRYQGSGRLAFPSSYYSDLVGTLTLNADNDINFDAYVGITGYGTNIRDVNFDFNAGGDINFTSGSVYSMNTGLPGGISLNGDFDLNAAGAITLNNSVAADNIILTAGSGGININSGLIASGNIAATSGGDIVITGVSMGTTTENSINSAGSISLDAAGGSIDVSKSMDAGTTLTLNSGTGVTASQLDGAPVVLSSDGDLSVVATSGNIALQSINDSLSGSIDLDAMAGSVSNTGVNTAAGSVAISAGTDVNVDGVITALMGGTMDSVTVSAGNDLVLNAAIVSNDKDIVLIADSDSSNMGSVTQSAGPLSAGTGNLTINSGNDFSSADALDGADVSITAGSGGVIINDQLDATGNVSIITSSGGNIIVNEISMGTLAENTINSGGSVLLSADRNVELTQDMLAGTTLTLSSANGNVISNTRGGTPITLQANGDLSVVASSGNITLNSFNRADAGDLIVDAAAGSVTLNQGAIARDDVEINGAASVNIAGFVASEDAGNISNGNVIFNAGGDLSLNDTTVSTLGDVYLESDFNNSGSGLTSVTDSQIGEFNAGTGEITNSVSIRGSGVSVSGTALGHTSIEGDSVTIVSNGAGNSIDITADGGVSGTDAFILGASEMTINSAGSIDIAAADIDPSASETGNRVGLMSFGQQTITASDVSISVGEGEYNAIAIQSYYGAGSSFTQSMSSNQAINVTNLTLDASAVDSDGYGGSILISSLGDQTINVANNFVSNGALVLDLSGTTTYMNIGIESSAAQTITVGNRLELNSTEIASVADSYTYALSNADSTITTNDLIVNNARIALDRPQTGDTSTFVLTITGANSTIDGILNPSGPEQYALISNGVKWVNQGTVAWNSGTVLISNQNLIGPSLNTDTKVLDADETLLVNQGTLELNSESGTFDMVLFDENGSVSGVGGVLNSGDLVKNSGTGLTNASLNLQNEGIISAASGTLEFGANVITQTGANAEIVLDGGNLSATGGSFNLLAGTLRGGTNEGGITSGGTLTGDLNLANATVDPGFSPGQLTIDGDLDASAGGNTFLLEIDANTGSFDQLVVTGTAILDSGGAPDNTVNVVQTGSFEPDLGLEVDENFDLIDSSSLVFGDTVANFDNQDDGSVTGSVEVVNGSLSINFDRMADVGDSTPENPAPENPAPENPAPENPAPEDNPIEMVDQGISENLVNDIIASIVNAGEDEQEQSENDDEDEVDEESRDSEDKKQFIKKVNMCLAKT